MLVIEVGLLMYYIIELSLFIQLVVHRLCFINCERTWNIFGLALVILSVQNMIVSSIALADYSCRSLAFILIL
jgi:hypothetical protein